ncbi:hypothetical protein ACLB2K_065581 [Fragaria x ananassa]
MMHTTLVNLQAMLQAAERLTQDQGDDVKIWLKKIEEIAGDVDDLLDDFGYEVLRCKVELLDQMKTNVFSIFDPIVFRHKMGRRIKNINETLVNLENQAAFQLVIAENATSDDPEVLDMQTAFCSDEDEKNIIGRGKIVSDIVTTLINSNTTTHQENLPSVLAILGTAGTEGSSIIVTARDVKVAKIMETLPRYDLTKLSDDECWLILKSKAVSPRSTLQEDQDRTGKEIAKKCEGVPLVAKVLGSLLRSKDSKEWLGIEKSPVWDLKKESSRTVLKFSYSELNLPSLKKCFSYCATFTKDSNMEKHDLIQCWMAMGLLEYLSPREHVSESMCFTRYSNKIQQVEHTSMQQRILKCKLSGTCLDLAFCL